MSDTCFLDSNIWLYAFLHPKDQDPRHFQSKQLISSLEKIVVSEQVLAEVSVNLLKKGSFPEGHLLRIIQSFYSHYRVVASHSDLHQTASTIRTRYGFSYWDSMIVSAALSAECALLYTEDLQHEQIIENSLKVINPFV